MAKKILVIDDDPSVRQLARRILVGEGYEVVVANNRREGLGKVEEEAPDLVVLDVLMPGRDGFAVLEKLKKTPATKAIPVVMLSASLIVGGDAISPKLRANHWLTKYYIRYFLALAVRVALSEAETAKDTCGEQEAHSHVALAENPQALSTTVG